MGLLDDIPDEEIAASIKNDMNTEKSGVFTSLLGPADREKAVESANLSYRYSVPADIISADLEAWKSRAEIDDADKALQKDTRLAKWLAASNNRLALSRKDITKLADTNNKINEWASKLSNNEQYLSNSYIDRFFHKVRRIQDDAAKGYEKGKVQDQLGLVGYRKLIGEQNLDQRIQDLQKKVEELQGTNGITENTAVILGQMMQGMGQHLSVGLTAATSALIAGQLGPQALSPEEAVTVPAAFRAGFNASIAERSYRVEAGNAFLDQIKSGIDENTAAGSAHIVGLINGMLEAAGFEGVTSPIKREFSNLIAGQAKKELFKMTRTAAAKQFLKDYAVAWGSEVSTEVLQEIVGVAGEEISKQITPNEVESLMATSEGRTQILDRLKGIFEQVGKGMAVLALPGASFHYAGNLRQARRARATEQAMIDFGQKFNDLSLKDSPQELENYVENATKDTPVENVYIDSDEFKQYFQTQGVDPEQIANEIPSVKDQWQEASTVGGDIKIPLSEYASKIAETKYHEGLLRHVRFDPNDVSISQADKGVNQEEIIAEAEKQIEQKNAAEQSAEKVKANIKAQILATGRYTSDVAEQYAILHSAFAKTMGRRLGISPEAVYKKFNLQFSAQDQKGKAYNQPAYHGSPYHFDKFTLDNMLGGEGVHAYGWGLYFADKKEVAQFYRDNLKINRSTPIRYDGKQLDTESYEYSAAEELLSFGLDKKKLLKHIEEVEGRDVWWGPDEVKDAIKKMDTGKIQEGGQLYKVNIPDDKGNYLKWDIPINQHDDVTKEKIVKAIKRLYDEPKEKVLNLDGSRIYEDLSESLGSQEAASLHLKKYGIEGIKYLDNSSRGIVGGDTYNYVIFDDKAIQVAKKYYQDKKGAFDPEQQIISLFQKADLSTVLHESGHFFLESVATMAKESPEIAKDFQVLLDWYGVKNREAWDALSFEEKRAYHEKFAEGFEKYLFDGKAPSLELRNLFSRFRDWLVSVYKTLTGDIPKEVRQVMDRMLATDEEIQTATAAAGYRRLFESEEQAKAAGMNKTEWEDYLAGERDANEAAKEELTERSLKDMKWADDAKAKIIKRLQRDAAIKRANVRAEITQQVEAEPVYMAMRWLKKGEAIIEGKEVKATEGFKLDADAVADVPIHEFVQGEAVPVDVKTKLRGMTAKDGVHPDIIAGMFGFESGDALVNALVEAKPMKEVIAERTAATLLERYGDLNDPAKFAEAARQAIHNDMRMKSVATEIKVLNRRLGSPRLLLKAARAFAEDKISGKKIKDVSPAKYGAAETRAAKEAEKALAKGKNVEAAAHKRAQMLNGELWRAANDARLEAEKTVKYLNKFQKKTVRQGLRGEMLQQLDALLSRFDLRKNISTGPRTKLAEFITAETERLQAAVPDINPNFTDETFRKPWKELTVAELRGLRDTVKQLEQLARREQKMYIERRNMQFDQEKTAMLEEFRAAHPEVFDGDNPKQYRKDQKPLLAESWGKFKSVFDSQMINMENMLDIATGGKGNQVQDSIFGRLSEAADAHAKFVFELGEYLKPYVNAYNIKEKMMFDRIYIKSAGEYMTKEKRIATVLFNGSKEGQQRLADGNGYSQEAIADIVKTLSHKDLDFINAFWRMSEEKIWPRLKALDERTKGVAPPKVEAVPMEVEGYGTLTGGYVPLVYDKELSTRAYDLNKEGMLTELRGGTVSTARTVQSASQTRLDKVDMALDLSLAGITAKINDTVHDITHREAVSDAYRLLKSHRISNAFKNIIGPEAYNAMLIKVRETAIKPIVPRGWTQQALWWARRNTMINIMGASFNTVAINVLGAFPAMRRVGVTPFLKAAASVEPALFLQGLRTVTGGKAQASYQWVYDKSEYMQGRFRDFDRDLNAELSRFRAKAKITPSLSTWFAGLAVMDKMIVLPTWIAAYQEAMRDGVNDEHNAVAYADRVVRQTQGSGRVIDLANVAGGVGTAGEFKRVMTMFYNFFNAQLGMMVRSQRLAAADWTAGRRARAAVELSLTTFAVIVLPATLEQIARGTCQKNGDNTDYLACAERSSVFFTASMFPLMRDVVPMMWKQFDPEANKFGSSVRLSPIESSFESLGKTPKSVVDLWNGEANQTDIDTMLRGFGFLFGLPGYQATRTIDGYQKFMDGESDDITDLLTGPQKK